MKKIKRGWRRVQEKRRRRHLVRAFEVFGKRRDKMIAFAEYAKKKLEVKMLKRGSDLEEKKYEIVDKYANIKFIERVEEVILRKDTKCSSKKWIKVVIQKKKSEIDKWNDETIEERSETCES